MNVSILMKILLIKMDGVRWKLGICKSKKKVQSEDWLSSVYSSMQKISTQQITLQKVHKTPDISHIRTMFWSLLLKSSESKTVLLMIKMSYSWVLEKFRLYQLHFQSTYSGHTWYVVRSRLLLILLALVK